MKKKMLKWVLLVIGVAVALIFSIYAIFDVASGSKLRTILTERKARGEPMSFNELVKQTPPENNAADTYIKIFNLMNSSYDQKTGGGELNKKFSPAFNVYSKKAYSKLSLQNRKAVEECIEGDEGKEFFRLLDKAVQKPTADFNLDYSQGVMLPLPHLNLIRNAIRIICAKALFESEKGNTDAAYAYIIKGLKLSRQMNNEPILITFLVKIANDNMLEFAALDIMKEKGIGSEMSEKLISELLKHDYHSLLSKAMDGEILMVSALFEDVMNDRCSLEKFMKDIDKKYGPIFLKASLKNDYATYLQLMSELKSNFNRPYRELKDGGDCMWFDRKIKEIPSYCILTRMLVPAYGTLTKKVASADSLNAYLITYTGIVNYKNKFSEYPAKLGDLSPKILKEIPLDFITGKCFFYIRDGKGFELKSEDLNLDDFINRIDKRK